MPVLNIIGCGRVGRTLAQLWRAQAVFDIGDVNDHSLEKSRAAVVFIGSGRACADINAMRPAGVWMLATPDDRIEDACRVLSDSALAPGDIVFHCSGALPSTVLVAAAARGALTASVHPLKTFADPSAAVERFSGTHCAAEGDAAALALLTPAFERIGAQVFALDASAKTLYHAASVLVCNDLTALMEAGARVFAAAGLPRADALRRVEPLVRETLDNVFRMGTAAALTGPVARGDVAVVQRQLAALSAVDGNLAEIYRRLAVIAADLAKERGGLPAATLAELAAALQNPRR